MKNSKLRNKKKKALLDLGLTDTPPSFGVYFTEPIFTGAATSNLILQCCHVLNFFYLFFK